MLGDLGVPAPPIPSRHRRKLRKVESYFWSSREDLTLSSMYDPDAFLAETRSAEPPEDYSAISYIGRGGNSYAWNLQIVQGPVAVMAQDHWGGGMDFNPVRDDSEIAYTYAWLRALLRMADDQLETGPIQHIVYSGRYMPRGIHVFDRGSEPTRAGRPVQRDGHHLESATEWREKHFASDNEFLTHWSSIYTASVDIWPEEG
jgi:hypothetical protein